MIFGFIKSIFSKTYRIKKEIGKYSDLIIEEADNDVEAGRMLKAAAEVISEKYHTDQPNTLCAVILDYHKKHTEKENHDETEICSEGD